MKQGRSILLLGLPRSGTTWVGAIVAQAEGVEYVFEPDNEKTSLLGRWYKRGVGRFPLLEVGQRCEAYERLWRCAARSARAGLLSRSWLTKASLPQGPLAERYVARKEARLTAGQVEGSGGARSTGMGRAGQEQEAGGAGVTGGRGVRLVKSVHGVLSAEWIAKAGGFDRVVVVTRHPLAILASWRRMKMPDAVRATSLQASVLTKVFGEEVGQALRIDESDRLAQSALHLAVLLRGLADAAARNPQWIVVGHEQLCGDVAGTFEALFAKLDLPFGQAVQEAIAQRNRAGAGYRANRVASAEIGKWRKDFESGEIERVQAVFEQCGMGELIEA